MAQKSNTLEIILIIIVIITASLFVIYTITKSNMNIKSNSYEINKNHNSSNTTHETDKKNKSTVHEETKIVEEEIANFTTTIYDRDENRVFNISLANEKLNNYIIKSGEEFSFNNTIGPMGGDAGFKKAIGFDSNGNKIQIYGGGLCQLSSTLYNTALIANLEITERHAHSARVYYVPKDKDATILYGSLDLKFKNNTDSDIKIISSNDDANVTVKLIKLVTKTEKRT